MNNTTEEEKIQHVIDAYANFKIPVPVHNNSLSSIIGDGDRYGYDLCKVTGVITADQLGEDLAAFTMGTKDKRFNCVFFFGNFHRSHTRDDFIKGRKLIEIVKWKVGTYDINCTVSEVKSDWSDSQDIGDRFVLNCVENSKITAPVHNDSLSSIIGDRYGYDLCKVTGAITVDQLGEDLAAYIMGMKGKLFICLFFFSTYHNSLTCGDYVKGHELVNKIKLKVSKYNIYCKMDEIEGDRSDRQDLGCRFVFRCSTNPNKVLQSLLDRI